MSGLRRNRSTKYADEYPPPTILRPICKETFKSHLEGSIGFQNVQDYQFRASWKLASEEAGIISRFVTRTKITEQAKVTSTVTARITVQLRDLKERNVCGALHSVYECDEKD
ncbi:hypothetical protein RB195_022837 [Necator americanus]|uniref:Uncharacterized protein n=1 Tax=Necator americanus TaxID=51031 RepID=A0ABR1EHQ1_NECAM